MTERAYCTQRLDHLGIVAGICDEIGLVNIIDRLVPAPRRQVTIGQAVKAMIINALGFVSRPLYLTPEFFANKPVELLLGPGITAEMLNDDSLGRALDALFEAGLTEIFAQVASHALRHYGIEHRFIHVDISSFHVHGAYEREEQPGVIRIARGYSRDHRPDLKQVVAGLLTTYRSALPTWIQALDGNAADVKAVPELIKAYVQQFQEGEEPYFVADSALYAEENLQALSEIKWVTRVPERIGLARSLEEAISVAEMRESSLGGYRLLEVCTTYGGAPQRWIIVYSEAARKRDLAALEKRIEREAEKIEKEMRKLAKEEFASAEALSAAVGRKERGWQYHRVEFTCVANPHYGRRGRPAADAEPEWIGWCIEGWQVRQDEEAVERARARCGKFILATNELDARALPAEEILLAYKGQGVGPERGFRFLKDPMFFADSLFLKSPRRIMALIMVMGLALLVYALAEHKLRQELQARNESIPNQVGKPTQRPTMRRIFQMFEGIDVLIIHTPRGVERHITNLTDLHRRILHLLGPAVEKCYLGPT
ncbi:MAG TPA: IS1634 family transposase [Chloroflexi bacterium]|nr:IS1634 family transposase [Chloroflexota bacterium]